MPTPFFMGKRKLIRYGKLGTAIPLLGLLLLLGGCASRQGLSTQGQLATPTYLSTGKTLAGVGEKYARSWPTLDWWHALGDAQLDGLIEEALQSNPDLAAADARMRQASALAMNADASRAPTAKAMGTVQGIHVPGKLLSTTSDDRYITPWILGVNGSYNADLWGGDRAAWEAALGRQRGSEVDAKAARLALSADVARAYAKLAYTWEAYDLAQRNAERARRLLDLTTQRVAAGIDSTAQQHHAEALELAARQHAMQAWQAIRNDQIALAILIGKGPDRAAEFARPAALRTIALAVPDNLPADLLGRRPDIVAARWRVEAAQRDIEAAKAQFYPSFNLTAAIGLASLHSDDLLSLRSRYYAVAPAISLPIFDGGRLRADLAGRNAEYDIAVAQYNKILVEALNDVALQLQVAQSLSARESAQQQAAKAAHEAWELSMTRYQRGIGSYLEALNAEQAVLETAAELTLIRAQQIDVGIQLIRALGGGYANAAVAASDSNQARPL